MTLIKKSDVQNHMSTKSRERREKSRPYPIANSAPEMNPAVDAPRDVAVETPAAPPAHVTPAD